MAIRAVVFDIGGVLEITPDLGVIELWETRLRLPAGNSTNACTTPGQAAVSARSPRTTCTRPSPIALGLDEQQLAAFMADIWREYLGTANTELIEYARRLRPRYRTGILSNSSSAPGNESRRPTDSKTWWTRSSIRTRPG